MLVKEIKKIIAITYMIKEVEKLKLKNGYFIQDKLQTQ